MNGLRSADIITCKALTNCIALGSKTFRTAPASGQQFHPTLLPPVQTRTMVVANAGEAAAAAPALLLRIKDDMKASMKEKNQPKLDAIRFLSSFIKQREIELRETSMPLTDDEIIKVIQKLAKQRKESIDAYKAGGRDDLVAKEVAELAVLEAYLPQQMSRQEVETLVAAAVTETGATSVKQMSQVMKVVMAKTAGRSDNKTISDLVKAALSK